MHQEFLMEEPYLQQAPITEGCALEYTANMA